jgi:hypothetical protein
MKEPSDILSDAITADINPYASSQLKLDNVALTDITAVHTTVELRDCGYRSDSNTSLVKGYHCSPQTDSVTIEPDISAVTVSDTVTAIHTSCP